MTTIQVRVKEKTKTKAKKILDDLGLDMSTAVNMYLEQIIHERAIPFQPKLTDIFTKKDAEEILNRLKDVEEGKNIIGPVTMKQFIKTLKEDYENHIS